MKIINKMKNCIKKWQKKQRFARDCDIYRSLNYDSDFEISENDIMPVYEDTEQAGRLDEHYFLQDIWMAKQIKMNSQDEHFDIGSRVDGFIAHLLSMNIEVTLIDIRSLDINLENLKFIQGDATNLSNINDESISSLSSLHAIEHFGLGRYGDDIEPDAWKKALHSFERVLKKGGYLYLSVPIGCRDHLIFNAHRIFNPRTIISELPGMSLVKFAYIDNYKIHEVENFNKIDGMMAEKDYLCGLFVFKK